MLISTTLPSLISFVNKVAFKDCTVAAMIASGSLSLYCLRSLMVKFLILLSIGIIVSLSKKSLICASSSPLIFG